MRMVKTNGCRTCKHRHYWVLSSFAIADCSHPDCKCKAADWTSADNLEYLEYLSDKKRSLKND